MLQLAGQTFGRLTVISQAEGRAYGHLTKWNCVCGCGNQVVVIGSILKDGGTKSCGCLRRERAKGLVMAIDELGKRYGTLTVIARSGIDHEGGALWECRCDCGELRIVQGGNLREGHTKSCGRLKCACQFTAPHIDNLTAAYFAGHFDGEGCIRFSHQHSTCPYPIASVQQCFKPITLEYKHYFGGSIYKVIKSGNRRVQWQWQVHRRAQLIHFINTIIKCSREKRSQLELAKDFLDHRSESFRNSSFDMRDQMPDLITRITELKKVEYAN